MVPTETVNERSDEEFTQPAVADGWICKYYSICDFFAQPDVPGTTEAALKQIYCFSRERWAGCHRLLHYQETGENPPNNLLPSGRLMPK